MGIITQQLLLIIINNLLCSLVKKKLVINYFKNKQLYKEYNNTHESSVYCTITTVIKTNCIALSIQ